MLKHKDIIVNDLWNKIDDLRTKIKLATKGQFTFSEDFKELKKLLLLLKEVLI